MNLNDKNLKVGDEVYDGKLRLGTVCRIYKPLIGSTEIDIKLASREAHDFLIGDFDGENFTVITKTWKDKVVDWINKLYDSLNGSVKNGKE